MGDKYAALTEHLREQRTQAVTLSFGDVRRILGFSLPASAQKYRAWWSDAGHRYTNAWRDAGFAVEMVSLDRGTVRFVRTAAELGRSKRPEQVVAVAPGLRAICSVERADGCHVDLDELKSTAKELVRLAGSNLSEIKTSWSLAPHKRPKSLTPDLQAVYCFFLGKDCLKVGKTGPDNNPRYVSHHYYCKSTSSLSKSILAKRDRVAKLLGAELHEELHSLDEERVGNWVEKHTSRLNVLLPATAGPHVLSLVEAFLHVRFQPVFEGHG